MGELLARVRNLVEMKILHKLMGSRNRMLEEMVRQRTMDLVLAKQSLQETRRQVIQRLGRAAEFRDNETGYHIIRMSKISEILGRACGLNDYDCELLLNASPMHDIGKIGRGRIFLLGTL
jgi:putative two-component system response regulator